MIQLETSTTAKLRRAFLDGFSDYLPFTSYSSSMFMLKRLAGVPGYQYKVQNETLQRQIFTAEEIRMISREYETRIDHEYRKYLTFYDKVLLIYSDFELPPKVKGNFEIKKHFEKILRDEIPSNLTFSAVDDSAIVFDDENYKSLSFRDKMFVSLNIFLIGLLDFLVTRQIIDILWLIVLFIMKRTMKTLQKKN